jgi:hypothetical protein
MPVAEAMEVVVDTEEEATEVEATEVEDLAVATLAVVTLEDMVAITEEDSVEDTGTVVDMLEDIGDTGTVEDIVDIMVAAIMGDIEDTGDGDGPMHILITGDGRILITIIITTIPIITIPIIILRHIANRNSSNPIIGTSVRPRRVTTPTSEIVRAVG